MNKFFVPLATAAVIAAGVSLASCSNQSAASVNIVPVPAQLETRSGVFTLTDGMSIGVAADSLKPAAEYLAGILSASTGFTINVTDGTGDISLKTASIEGAPGAYTLKSSGSGVEITGNSYAGVIYGIESLRQMLPAQIESTTKVEGIEWNVPAADIKDEPAFGWRGIMLDVSRHFYSPAEVKEFLDLMALYKLNKFHWHLTDDQGWRVEIKKYPLLTEKGAWRKYNSHDRECLRLSRVQDNPDYALPSDKLRITEEGDTLYGGFYTQDEIRDIVAYAAVRGIDVVPEIDMPGHMLAAVSNYKGVSCFDQTGWGATFSSPVCPGKESAMEFCKNVYDELIDLFPYEYVHIGGDEVEKTNWKKCRDCQKRMADNGLKTEEELQSWFIHQMEDFINSKGKKMIGWDEILEGGLSKTATVMWWRSWSKDAPRKSASQGNYVIYTPNSQFYLDYMEDKNSIPGIIGLDFGQSMPDTLQNRIMGVQGNIWCEWIPSRERMHYQAVPRLLAIAELGWAHPGKSSVEDFDARMAGQFDRLNVLGINYRIPDLTGFNATNVFTDSATLDISCLDPTAQIRYTTDGSVPTAESTLYQGPVTVTETTDFTLATFRPSGKRCNVVTTRFLKESYSPAAADVKADKPGLVAQWYDYAGDKCADITTAADKGSYEVPGVEIPKECSGNIGLVITGYIDIPADGIYTFALLSDDGSVLSIDGAIVIDNDGPHSPREIVGQKALAKGMHPLKVEYFDHNGGQLRMIVTDAEGRTLEPAALYRH